MKTLLLFCAFCILIGCGLNTIPYSDETSTHEPNEVAQSHYKWGLASAKNGNHVQAITEFKLAIQNEPGWALPYYNLGAVYGNIGELYEAIIAWERATQLDPNFAKAYYNLAIGYSIQAEETNGKNLEKAIFSLREAIQLDKASLASAKIEPAFNRIRNLPEYKELIQSTEPKQ
jgi:tetratricopeptide (TPR) repeat protein